MLEWNKKARGEELTIELGRTFTDHDVLDVTILIKELMDSSLRASVWKIGNEEGLDVGMVAGHPSASAGVTSRRATLR